MEKLRYPTWAVIICICLVILAIMPVPVVFLLRHFNIIKQSNSSLSSVSYKKGRIIKESPPPGEFDDTSFIGGRTPGEAPLLSYSRQSDGGPDTDPVPNGHYSIGYLMVDETDVPESDL